MSVIDCFRKGFDRIWELANTTLTIRQEALAWNDQDDPDPTVSTYNVQGVIQIVDQAYTDKIAGQIEIGDAIVYVKYDVGIETGNYIWFNQVWYEVKSSIPERTAGNKAFLQLHCFRHEYLTKLYMKFLTEQVRIE